MYRWFEPAIGPVLDDLEATAVVEVGSDQGHLTKKLLDHLAPRNGVVHAIDPRPRFDVDAWQAEYGSRLVLHRGLSLSVIPTLPSFDAMLIDGDHNWFTVINELRSLDRLVSQHGRAWPIVMLHDVGWPYGRRDLYYDPSTIPDEFRQPYRRAGLHPEVHEPSDGQHFNAHLDNALYENTPRNGVLTAVEEFLSESVRDLTLLVLDGVNGLAVVWDESSTAATVNDRLRGLTPNEPVRQVTRAIEHDRLIKLTELAATAHRLRAATAAHEQDAEVWRLRQQEWDQEREALSRKLAAQDEAATRRESEVRAQLDDTKRRLGEATREQDRLNSELRDARNENSVVTARLGQRTAEYDRLRRRRVVRVALKVAALAKPAFRTVRQSTDADRHGPVTPPQAMPQVGRLLALPSEARADVVVCIHDAPDDVRRCLDSIVEHTNLDRHRLVLVDDGSDDETASLVRDFVTAHPDTTLVRNQVARGYTCAANQGIGASSSPFFVLLNSDTVVTPGWLDALITCATTMPDAAIVGPLSNAASWQSIPETIGEDGGWVVNELPSGVTPQDVAQELTRRAIRLYPELALINGFCYLVRRDVVEAIGPLDEDTFPTGYGEEDDFSLRAHQAGYRAYLADDVYVFHAKSKSFTPAGRQRHVQTNRGRLADKHSQARIREAVDAVRYSDGLVRARTFASLVSAEVNAPQPPAPDLQGLRVGWAQPHLGEVGGIRRAIEMTNLLHEWGADVSLITPDGESTNWLPIRGQVLPHAEAATRTYDVLMVSDPDVVGWATDISAKERLVFHLAAYLRYREQNDGLDAFYDIDGTHIANSLWTAQQITDRISGDVIAVVPGAVDRRLFHPVRAEAHYDVVCYGSKREHKGTVTIEEAAASAGRTLSRLADARLPQGRLAEAICRGRVFASGAWHEGFNLPPLEAMACGVPVAQTDDGGSRDYAVHEQNALVVSVRDAAGLAAAIDRLIEDLPLRIRLIEAGMKTAWGYTWERATRQLADVLAQS